MTNLSILTSCQCSVCGESLHGTYFTFLDKLVCEKDYKASNLTVTDLDIDVNLISVDPEDLF